jgi:phenylalanyl-tRNA synthetase beta chain
VRLFEIGSRFTRSGGERRAIAAVWSGAVGGDHWSGGTRPVDFFDIKGVAERIGAALGLELQVESVGRVPPETEASAGGPGSGSWLVAGRAAALMDAGKPVGYIGLLSPAVAEQHGLTAADAVFGLELDLDAAEALVAGRATHVEALPRFPSVARDISILIDETLLAADVRQTIRQAAPPTLARIREFDRYQGKGIPEGKVSLSIRLTFRSADRTLTDAEINAAMDAVLGALKTKHAAVQR